MERRRSTGGKAVNVQLIGKSSELLAELSRDVAKVLRLTEGLENVRSDAETGDKEVQVVINRGQAQVGAGLLGPNNLGLRVEVMPAEPIGAD